MATIHDDVVPECCNDPMTYTIKCTGALSVLGSRRNPEDGNVSANVLINDNDSNEFGELDNNNQVFYSHIVMLMGSLMEKIHI